MKQQTLTMQDAQATAKMLSEALPYLQRFSGAVVVVKMIVTPLAMWQLARLYGGDELAQGIALLCGAAPGAASAYVLARQMGGDAPLMAGIIAATTVFSVIGIPAALLLFHLA